MVDAQRQRRLRDRAAALPSQGQPAEDPLRALEPLRQGLRPLLLWLLLWAALAPSLTGSPSAAWLAGAPVLALALLALRARRERQRRVALLLATALCAFLALASAPALVALPHLSGPRPGPVLYQLACLLAPLTFLLRAGPAWRRFNLLEAAHAAQERLRDEL